MASGQGSRLRFVGSVVVLACLAGIVFASAANKPLIADDYFYLTEVQKAGWWHSNPTWEIGGVLFRPVLFLWFGATNWVFGLDATGFHVTTVLIVVAAGVMTGLVAHRIGLRAGAYAAATIVALHGSMATPVAWASAANSPLAVALALGALYLLLRPRVRLVEIAGASILFLVALMTREVVAVAPAILLMTRFLVEKDGSRKTRCKRAALVSVPLWVVVLAYVGIRRSAGFEGGSGGYAQEIGGHGLDNLVDLMKFATNVAPFGDESTYNFFVAVFWIVFIGLCVFLAIRFRRFGGVVGLAWAVLAVLPVIFLSVHRMENYYVDFALPGLAIAIAVIFEWIYYAIGSRDRWMFAAPCLVVFVALSASTARDYVDNYVGPWGPRTEQIIEQVTTDFPDPAPGSTVSVRGATPNEHFLTHNGDLFRVIYHDPTLQVTFVPE